LGDNEYKVIAVGIRMHRAGQNIDAAYSAMAAQGTETAKAKVEIT
jgi:hypothetical protein